MKNLKSKILNLKLVCCLLLTAYCLLFSSTSFAIITNINSGATHEAIVDAVDAADSGDTLLVSTGLYSYVSLNIINKSLTIIGGYALDFSDLISSYDTVFEASGYCISFSHSTSIVERLTLTGSVTGMESYNSSIVTARYCTVENNISYFPGAGLYVHSGGILVLQSTYVENNSSTNTGINGYGGGAFVASNGKLIISENSRIKNNSATVRGGGVYINGAYFEVSSKAYVSGNTAGEDGGGVYIDNGTLLVHDRGDIGYQSFDPNTAGEDGGGIYAVNSLVTLKDSGTYLYNNFAEKKGGGAYISGGMMLVIDGAEIGYDKFACSNSCENGGGIYAANGSIVAITNSAIRNCYGKFGAGVFSDDSTIFIKNSEIGNTNDLYTNISKYDGGGIYAIGGTCIVYHSTFVNNQVGDEGGAFLLANCDMSISNSILINNKAVKSGGAVFAFFDSILNVSDSTIVSNSANDGGGIWWDSNTNMTVVNSTLNYNVADNNGGGALVAGSGLASFNNVGINRNNADANGGGIYVSDGQIVKLIDSDIGNNDAEKGSGIFIRDSANVEFSAMNNDALMQGNVAKYGGGIYIEDENSIIDIISTSGYQISMPYNLASTAGGAIYADSTSKVSVLGDVKFSHCSADYGGAAYISRQSFAKFEKIENYQPVIESCSADISGGGICVITPDTLVSCNGVLFGGKNKGNKAKSEESGDGGGAVVVSTEAEFIAVDCVFQENNTLSDGGAIAVFTASAIVGSNVTAGAGNPISNSLFIKNIATNTGYGGAIYVDNGVAQLYNIAVISNRAHVGGGIYANYSDAFLENVLIANNYSYLIAGGDGMSLFYADASVNNCTIAYNDNSGINVGNNSSVSITNSIIWGHEDYQITTNPVQTVVFSDIEGGYSGVGNISSHPLFWDQTKLKYQILEGSPCINAGTNLSWMASPTTDLDGNERIHDGTVDMGCYEFIPEPFCLSFIIYYLLLINWRRK
jgi:predicted outer membrane repeat protein